MRRPGVSLVLCGAGCVFAQKHCVNQPADPLLQGVTMAFASPIFRLTLLAEEAPELEIVAQAAQQQNALWSSKDAECQADGAGVDDNDRFFLEQRKQFYAGQPSFLETDGVATASILRTWRELWLQAVHQYLMASLGAEAAAGVGALKLFVWAGVHAECDSHPRHVHPESLVSGVFYIRAPTGSGALVLDDPRGPRPPFHRNRITMHPRAGELVLFPP